MGLPADHVTVFTDACPEWGACWGIFTWGLLAPKRVPSHQHPGANHCQVGFDPLPVSDPGSSRAGEVGQHSYLCLSQQTRGGEVSSATQHSLGDPPLGTSDPQLPQGSSNQRRPEQGCGSREQWGPGGGELGPTSGPGVQDMAEIWPGPRRSLRLQREHQVSTLVLGGDGADAVTGGGRARA